MSAPFSGTRKTKGFQRFNHSPRVSNRAGAFLLRGRLMELRFLIPSAAGTHPALRHFRGDSCRGGAS